LFRRAIVIPFNNKFLNEKADTTLKDTLIKEELSGILNLVLQAFGDVIKRGVFTEPQSCLDVKKEWRLEADQVAQFVGEKCVLRSEFETSSSELYETYKSWADDAGITRKLNRKNFANRLVRLGCVLHKGRGGERIIKGIRIGWEGR
jgi:putative DNA primase/helicase